MNEVGWTLIVEAAACGKLAIPSELAGYLVLGIADAMGENPVLVDDIDLRLGADGQIRVTRTRSGSISTCDLQLRHLLGQLLAVSSSRSAALSRIANAPAASKWGGLGIDLQTALVPVNRAAARRALARLHREMVRPNSEGALRTSRGQGTSESRRLPGAGTQVMRESASLNAEICPAAPIPDSETIAVGSNEVQPLVSIVAPPDEEYSIDFSAVATTADPHCVEMSSANGSMRIAGSCPDVPLDTRQLGAVDATTRAREASTLNARVSTCFVAPHAPLEGSNTGARECTLALAPVAPVEASSAEARESTPVLAPVEASNAEARECTLALAPVAPVEASTTDARECTLALAPVAPVEASSAEARESTPVLAPAEASNAEARECTLALAPVALVEASSAEARDSTPVLAPVDFARAGACECTFGFGAPAASPDSSSSSETALVLVPVASLPIPSKAYTDGIRTNGMDRHALEAAGRASEVSAEPEPSIVLPLVRRRRLATEDESEYSEESLSALAPDVTESAARAPDEGSSASDVPEPATCDFDQGSSASDVPEPATCDFDEGSSASGLPEPAIGESEAGSSASSLPETATSGSADAPAELAPGQHLDGGGIGSPQSATQAECTELKCEPLPVEGDGEGLRNDVPAVAVAQAVVGAWAFEGLVTSALDARSAGSAATPFGAGEANLAFAEVAASLGDAYALSMHECVVCEAGDPNHELRPSRAVPHLPSYELTLSFAGGIRTALVPDGEQVAIPKAPILEITEASADGNGSALAIDIADAQQSATFEQTVIDTVIEVSDDEISYESPTACELVRAPASFDGAPRVDVLDRRSEGRTGRTPWEGVHAAGSDIPSDLDVEAFYESWVDERIWVDASVSVEGGFEVFVPRSMTIDEFAPAAAPRGRFEVALLREESRSRTPRLEAIGGTDETVAEAVEPDSTEAEPADLARLRRGTEVSSASPEELDGAPSRRDEFGATSTFYGSVTMNVGAHATIDMLADQFGVEPLWSEGELCQELRCLAGLDAEEIAAPAKIGAPCSTLDYCAPSAADEVLEPTRRLMRLATNA